ncbi:F-box only protein 7 [Ambystoma mexicanum]|uniref:F-box only protein 7 n=1 Tax=Ambystoma mexicanum TaxID=8296 RepID=UPI0037E831E7
MKLRVRVQKQTYRVELETEEPTLHDLSKEISESLLPSLGYSSDTEFVISLNGKEPLTGDQDALSLCGIISGDLVHVVLSETAAVLRPPQQIPSHSPLLQNGHEAAPTPVYSEQAGMAAESQQNRPLCAHTDTLVMLSEDSDFGVTPDEEALGCYPSDPMLCSEAVDGKIPHSLETLYHQADCTNANEALLVVLHLLMLETGYLPKGSEGKAVAMPETWRGGGVYKLQYTHPLCDDGSATLACVPMGNLIVINATLKINNNIKSVKRLQLFPASYISAREQEDNVAGIYKDLQKLSRLVKDQLVYPLLASARQALNLPDVFGLVVLPLELKLRILRLLDMRSIIVLSAVCRDLYVATSDPSLWRFLYLRDFRDSIPRPRDTDWKEIYCKKYKQKKEALRWRHMFFQPPPPHPLPLHPSPFYPDPFAPRPLYPPGIIGGEYDQRLVFPYIADPINSLLPSMGQTSGRFLPFRPSFNPIGSLQDTNPTLPGRAGPRSSRGRPSDIRRAFI